MLLCKPLQETTRTHHAAYVDLIGPSLMFEYVTYELASCVRMVEGTPDEIEKDPWATPGVDAVSLVG
jgi:hypothetical protein